MKRGFPFRVISTEVLSVAAVEMSIMFGFAAAVETARFLGGQGRVERPTGADRAVRCLLTRSLIVAGRSLGFARDVTGGGGLPGAGRSLGFARDDTGVAA